MGTRPHRLISITEMKAYNQMTKVPSLLAASMVGSDLFDGFILNTEYGASESK